MVKVDKGLLFVREEIAARHNQWTLIRDCLEGEIAVKAKGFDYLPYPSTKKFTGSSTDDEKQRYRDYKNRAVFFNVVGRTLHDLLAQVFVKEPHFKVDENDVVVKEIINNASGDGVTLTQTANTLLRYVLSYGYAGLLLDLPSAPATTVAEYNDLKYKPNLVPISPFKIRNFKYDYVDGLNKLTMLVLESDYWLYDSDGFEIARKPELLVYRLTSNGVVLTGYRETESNGWRESFVEKLCDSVGKPVYEIPFSFIGIDNNNPYPDTPIMYDLASVNISHYRNSADYEEMLFIAGQPTLILSGLRVDRNKTNDTGIRLGSRSAILLDNGGTSSLMQVKSDSGLAENLERKEKLMAKIGAKFLDVTNVSKTATQVKLENPSQGSILGKCALNVSNAIENILKLAHKVLNLKTDDISFALNTDYEYNKISSDNVQIVLNCYNDGVMTLNEVRSVLNRMGLTFDKVEGMLKITKGDDKEVEKEV